MFFSFGLFLCVIPDGKKLSLDDDLKDFFHKYSVNYFADKSLEETVGDYSELVTFLTQPRMQRNIYFDKDIHELVENCNK